jgi:hypothetical protein
MQVEFFRYLVDIGIVELRLPIGNVAIASLRNSNHHRKAPTRRPRKSVMASEVIASRMTPMP